MRGPRAAPLGSSGSPPALSQPPAPLSELSVGAGRAGPRRSRTRPPTKVPPPHPVFCEGAGHQGLDRRAPQGTLSVPASAPTRGTGSRPPPAGHPPQSRQAWYPDALAQDVPPGHTRQTRVAIPWSTGSAQPGTPESRFLRIRPGRALRPCGAWV